MRHDRCCFGRLEQEDQRLKTHYGCWMDIVWSLELESCISTKLTGMEGFVNVVNMHDSSFIDHTMSIQRPYCFFNLWSSCSSRPNHRRSCLVLLPPVAGCDADDPQV